MASCDDDGPPPSEDDSNTLDEDTAAEEASESVSEAATETVLQEIESSSTDAEEPEPSSIEEPNCSAMIRAAKKIGRFSKQPDLSADSHEELDPDNPPTPMTVLKVPKQFEKFTTKIKLQPATRAKGAATAKALISSAVIPSSNQAKTKPIRGSGGCTSGDKETITKSKKSKKVKPVANGKSNSLKATEPPSKGQAKIKSKQTSARQEGKSVRKPKPDAAVEMIKQLIWDMNGGKVAAISKMEQPNGSSYSMSASAKAANTRSILPEPKTRAKTNKTKGYKAKAKAMATKGKDKSRFSSRVRGGTDAPSPAAIKEKQKPEPKRVSIKKANHSTSSKDSSNPAPKNAFDGQVMPEQIKAETTSSKANALVTDKAINIVGKRSDVTRAVFTNDEMEDLNDELSDLNTSINTLRHSYGSIIRSLANLQHRRAKKKAALAPVIQNPADAELEAPDGGTSGLASTIEDICERVTVNYGQKFNLDRFVEADSRDGVFMELFREVNQINMAMARFKTFFNAEGYFQQDAYKAQDEFQLSREQYIDCFKVIKDLAKAVITILKAYNTDLLDMFRITSQAN